MDRIVESLTSKYWLKPKGLAATSFLILPAILGIFATLKTIFPNHIFTKNDLSFWIILFEVLHSIVWVISKLIYRKVFLTGDRILVAFAITIDKDSKDVVEKTIKEFRRNIYSVDQTNFRVETYPQEVSFKENRAAEKYAKNNGVDLLIWGDTESGTDKGEKITILHPSFTFHLRTFGTDENVRELQLKKFLKTIEPIVKGKKLSINHTSTLPSIKIVSDNLSAVSLYMISKCLMSFGYLEMAYKYLLRLREEITNESEYLDKKLIDELSKRLSLQLAEFLSYYFSVISIDHDKASYYCQQALSLNPGSLPALVNYARLLWLQGKRSQARQLSVLAWRTHPGNDIIRCNLAFFALVEGKYKKAIKSYNSIKRDVQTNILDVIEFLEREFESSNDLALLFGAGYLNIRSADTERGKQLLQKFVEKATAQNPGKFSPLIRRSTTTLSSL